MESFILLLPAYTCVELAIISFILSSNEHEWNTVYVLGTQPEP